MKQLKEMTSHSFDFHKRYHGIIEQLQHVLNRNKFKNRTLEKYSNTFNKNKQKINPACACDIFF